MRVGGQIRRSGLNEVCVHPIILPKKLKVTELIVKWCYLKASHCGRCITLNFFFFFFNWDSLHARLNTRKEAQ